MSRHNHRNQSYLIFGGLVLLLGLSLLLFRWTTVTVILFLTGGIMIIIAFLRLWDLLFGQKYNASSKDKVFQYIVVAVNIVFAIYLVSFRTHSYLWLLRMIGVYQLLMAVLNFISYLLMRHDGAYERYHRLLFFIFHLVFGLDSLLGHQRGIHALNRLGIYLLLLGLTYLLDGRSVLIDPRKEASWRRALRIPLPVLFSALLPQKIINEINQFIAGNPANFVPDFEGNAREEENSREPRNQKITVQVHVGSGTLDVVGHMNIAYKGIVYSYGSHDIDSRRLFDTVGDGVLVLLDQKEYIDFSIRHKVTIVEYDIAINEREAQLIDDKIQSIMTKLSVWQPSSKAVLNAYAGKILRETKQHAFYKFNEGQFQTYFVFWTNCVLLTDVILEAMGLDLFPLAGIQTPGTYYSFLEREYQKPKSIITQRRVYSLALRNYLAKLAYPDPQPKHWP